MRITSRPIAPQVVGATAPIAASRSATASNRRRLVSMPPSPRRATPQYLRLATVPHALTSTGGRRRLRFGYFSSPRRIPKSCVRASSVFMVSSFISLTVVFQFRFLAFSLRRTARRNQDTQPKKS
jgi:hypothetical protein